MVYLDNAATTRVCPEAAEAAVHMMTECFGNPSTTYKLGREAKAAVDKARGQIAKALGCQPDEVYFTSCGSEGDNWALISGARSMRRRGKHIISSAVEHDAVRKSLDFLEKEGYEITRLQPDGTGAIPLERVRAALRPDTILVSLMLVNNETGAINDIAAVARMLKAENSIALLHTDAVQGFLKVPCSAKTLGADFLTISAHKIGGPKGAGALYTAPALRNLRPLLPGGGQEGGLRSGTEATAQIAGFARAVELRRENLEEKLLCMAKIRDYAAERLSAIPDLKILSAPGGAPHILSISLVGWPSQNIVNDLGSQGICISAGSACHRGKLSHVYAAMKLDKKTAAGVLRVSFAPETTREEIDAFVSALRKHKETRFPML